MSDATLPPPDGPSSTAPAIGDGNRSDSSGNEVAGDSNMCPLQSSSQPSNEESVSSFGTKAPVKQKRKRTSPKDQAILEAEYKQNPKPNKAARAVIMEKVDLNEKELQIWFQNRRQINRRKSRPLLPHELAAFGLGGMAALSSDPSSIFTFNGSGVSNEVPSLSQDTSGDKDNLSSENQLHDATASTTQSTGSPTNPSPQGETYLSKICTPSLPLSSSMLGGQSPESSTTAATSLPASESVIKSFSSTPGYLANRWNPANGSSSTPASTQITPQVTPIIASNPTLPSSCPERIDSSKDVAPSAKVRLSMSLDGKAELVAADLSPIRQFPGRPSSSGAILPQHRMRGLQRSHSSISFSPMQRLPPGGSTLIPRLPRGRSRDSRNWEFFCDSEARDELTTQAEHESNGSAVAAISLLRSASNSALKSSNNKRNAPPSRRDSSINEKRPKLGRATSSLARLQGTGKPSLVSSQSNKIKPTLMGSPSGDSDKENWIPQEGGNMVRRRPLPSNRPDRPSQSQAILGENSKVVSHAVNLGGGKNRRRKANQAEPQIFEDGENGEANPEVEKFMRGEVSPSKKGDLDCIQGLLSLSQGNWR